MPRFCCGCCLSRKKHKSFPIHEKQRETEVNKVFIKHVETIRISPPPINKQIISKATIKKKSDDIKTIKENNSSVSKLFQKSRQLQTPSPLPMTISDIPEEIHDKTVINTVSSSSSSINTYLHTKKKPVKHQSYAETYNISKEDSSPQKHMTQPKNKSNDRKSPAKSKLVLENVRKMIKDQNIQQQHFNNTQQKESARL